MILTDRDPAWWTRLPMKEETVRETESEKNEVVVEPEPSEPTPEPTPEEPTPEEPKPDEDGDEG